MTRFLDKHFAWMTTFLRHKGIKRNSLAETGMRVLRRYANSPYYAGTSQEAVESLSHGQPEKCRGAETKSMRPDMDRLMEMTFERNR